MKALVGTINQEKALVGAFCVIVQLHRLIVCNSSRSTSLSFRTPDRPPLVDRWNRMSDFGLLPSLALRTVSMISITT